MITRELLKKLNEKYDSFYLYDQSGIIESMEKLKKCFEGVQFLYSVKANPNPQVVKTILTRGFGVDAASLAEVMMGAEYNLPKEHIQFSAPGKTEQNMATAIDKAIITADSLHEVELLQKIAEKKGIVAQIGIRLNPDFGFDGGPGGPSKFGIDEQQVYEAIPTWKTYKNIEVVGIHVHLHSQELDISLLEGYYENLFKLAERIQNALGYELKFMNMGSGIGIPFREDDKPVDVERLGSFHKEQWAKFRQKFPNTKIYIETGRFLSGKAGIYVTKVVDKKVSHGQTFVILNATLNGFVRPSIAQLVLQFTDAERPPMYEPYYTGRDSFGFIPLTDNEEKEKVNLVGSLCTGTDVIAADLEIKKLDIGDAVIITNAGCYAIVLSPMQFASLKHPAELFLKEDGKVIET